MTPTTSEQAVINEGRWQEWLEKGKLHDKAVARKFKLAAGIVLALAILGVALYLFSFK